MNELSIKTVASSLWLGQAGMEKAALI